jgi:hypothetical protein
MRRLIDAAGAGALVALLALVPAWSHAQQAGDPPGQEPQQDQQQAGQDDGRTIAGRQPPTSAAGTVRGRVTNLNLAGGSVTLSTGQGSFTVNAVPTQLAALTSGEVVALTFYDFNGIPWLAKPRGGGSGQFGPESFGQFGTASGSVGVLNKSRGLLLVRGVPFRAHPVDLENVLPGQFVSVTFAQIGGVYWADRIEAVEDSGAGLGGAGQ